MKNIQTSFFLILVACMIVIVACQPTETTPEPETPINQLRSIDPDLASSMLVFPHSTQIDGQLPPAPDGQIKMEVRDTIFSVKGYPLGNRIQLLKEHHSQDISGYYVAVKGASFYFDVPEEFLDGQYIAEEESDTSSVLILDLDPGLEDVNYPLTVEITIQPHTPTGDPLDQFDRVITVEDPADKSVCNTIAAQPSNNRIHWIWDYTIREYNGQILNVLAPDIATTVNSIAAGCCAPLTGKSYTVSSSPSCVPNVNTPHMQWKEYHIADFSVRPYELWQIYNDGTVSVWSVLLQSIYNRSRSDFCGPFIAFDPSEEDIYGEGTHDFVSGGEQFNFDWSRWDGGYRPRGGTVIYTCHTMIRCWGVEEKFSAVYKKADYSGPQSPNGFFENYLAFKEWFD
ncbi:MAG: hypothetical protein AAF587_40940 [Bacteroidota bacterium]